MKKAKIVLLLVLCAVLLVGASVAGTVAYLTSSKTVTNTFTVGNVQIELYESIVNDMDEATGGRTDEGNAYHLLPGHTYTKDPTVHILEGSESAYIRVLVKVRNYSNLKAAMPVSKYPTYYANGEFLLQYLVTGWEADKWVSTGVIATADNVATYEFRYYKTVAGPAKDTDDTSVAELALEPLFKTITIPGTVNNTELANLQYVTITVEAHAIQEDGFADEDAAWTAFAAN